TALPSSSHTGTVQTAILRPFAPDAPNAAFAIVRLPCSRAYSPAVLVARSESALRSEYNEAVPQAWLYAASRALDSLAQTNAAGSKDGYGPELWTRWDKRMAPYFNRTGPYLSTTAQALTHAGSYRAFFERALAGCALVSPSPDSPSVIPPDFDDGELTKLARALENGTSHA
ncbi:MAG TPA: hypothetical protein PLC54_05030, partial [Spirochaetales bacterium]|nr:hypothetical protein [Spirochaetales bacterium]